MIATKISKRLMEKSLKKLNVCSLVGMMSLMLRQHLVTQNFVSSLKMLSLSKRFFLHKINKSVQKEKKTGMNCHRYFLR